MEINVVECFQHFGKSVPQRNKAVLKAKQGVYRHKLIIEMCDSKINDLICPGGYCV